MSKITYRALKRRARKLLRNKPLVVMTVVGVFCIGAILYAQYMPRRLSADPATYTSLLNLIAQVESKDNYNAYFGNARNASIRFTDMTIAEVLAWQKQFVAEGNASSAVGRYQMINTTLDDLVRKLGLDTKAKFDQPTQDRLAMALLERRGAVAYVNNELTPHEFAANLAKEWAALPRTIGEHPETSYYAGDGLNQALVPVDHVLRAIEPIRARQ